MLVHYDATMHVIQNNCLGYEFYWVFRVWLQMVYWLIFTHILNQVHAIHAYLNFLIFYIRSQWYTCVYCGCETCNH